MLFRSADHLAEQDSSVLPQSVLTAIDGRIGMFEERMARLLYKQTVEMDITSGILADVCRLSEEDMRRRRAESVRNVKQTNGKLTFENRMRSATEEFELNDGDEDDDPWQS